MHIDYNQTLYSRVGDPIAYESVWAIIDDGCNSRCHREVWRQNAEAKMKVLGLHSHLAALERQLISIASERARQVEH